MFLTKTIETLNPDESGNCNIAPSDRVTVYSFSAPTHGECTIVVDTSNCNVGDQIAVLLHWDGGEETLTMNYPTDKFLFTWCGGPEDSVTLDGNDMPNEFLNDFYFDGEKFLCTFDLN